MFHTLPAPQLNGLSLEELQRLLAQTDAAIAERRVEELKVLADGFARKLAINGFSVREGMDALKPYLRVKSLGAKG
jgi:DNA-binding protein H-NS